MPDVPAWPDAPCGYLMLGEEYRPALEQAQSFGWPSRAFHAGHFHMLADPVAVAGALIELMRKMDDRR
jgi:hypothetical protein